MESRSEIWQHNYMHNYEVHIVICFYVIDRNILFILVIQEF